VILLDAHALLALARQEEAGDEVEALIRSEHVGMATANLFEVSERLMRLYGWSPNDTSEHLGQLVGSHIRVVALDEGIAWRGALMRARHYRRRECELSLADCVLLASAEPDDSVATSDPAVAAVARAEGIGLVALPGSSGQRP
jgi:PIN domain nuclease of toxin-antitoxin system